jgi:hypothetical protein
VQGRGEMFQYTHSCETPVRVAYYSRFMSFEVHVSAHRRAKTCTTRVRNHYRTVFKLSKGETTICPRMVRLDVIWIVAISCVT